MMKGNTEQRQTYSIDKLIYFISKHIMKTIITVNRTVNVTSMEIISINNHSLNVNGMQ